MRFLKYAGIGLGIQILFLILIVVANSFLHLSFLVDLAIGIYYPFIIFLLQIGKYKGESGMIDASLVGIVLGMFFYSSIPGIVLTFLKRNK